MRSLINPNRDPVEEYFRLRRLCVANNEPYFATTSGPIGSAATEVWRFMQDYERARAMAHYRLKGIAE